MTIPMKSLKAHTYAGKRLKAGDPFDARGESDKRVLVAIKAAEVAPAVVVAPAPTPAPVAPARYMTRAVATEQPSESAEVDQPPGAEASTSPAAKKIVAAKRSYQRRDLTAEE